MLALPADHFIGNGDAYLKTIQKGIDNLEGATAVVFGITPIPGRNRLWIYPGRKTCGPGRCMAGDPVHRKAGRANRGAIRRIGKLFLEQRDVSLEQPHAARAVPEASCRKPTRACARCGRCSARSAGEARLTGDFRIPAAHLHRLRNHGKDFGIAAGSRRIRLGRHRELGVAGESACARRAWATLRRALMSLWIQTAASSMRSPERSRPSAFRIWWLCKLTAKFLSVPRTRPQILNGWSPPWARKRANWRLYQ